MANIASKIVCALVFGFLGAAAGFAVFLAATDYSVSSDYTVKEIAEKPNDVITALSNAMERVTSKGFMLSEINIIRPPVGNDIFVVKCGGIDKKAFFERYKK